MSFLETIERARAFLERQKRVSLRALRREFGLDTEALDELVEELVDVQRVARREENVLVWLAQSTPDPAVPRLGTVRPTDRAEAHGAEARKVVTIIFADLIGSTSLHERLDAESVTRLMERYYRAMRGAVEAHGGTVVKLMGDGVMAAFGVPRVAEDDAIRAVHAGVAMQDAFRELAHNEFAAVGAIGLRVGINTGEVVVNADNTDVVGDPVNVAARLQTEAHLGEVVIGESTRRLVAALVTLAPLGSFALKGRAEAMKAYRVESLDRPVAATTAAFVGRDDELARISAVYEAALATPAARLAVLLGSPGLGKSRLIEEVTRRLAETPSVVTAHCDAAGGATFAPVAAGLREFFEIEAGASLKAAQAVIEAAIPVADTERTRIAGGIAALLGGSPASPEETFFVIRRLLAGLAAAKPVVLVIDDLQWAEPLLLDLVEHLVQWGSGTPLLVLVGARPELRDLRSSLATPGGFVADVVTLSGLDAGAAMRLAANVIGAADLPAAVAAKVLATSEGNPLFVGELVRMLVDEGAIERQGERWIVGANLAALEMPPTIHALLAARIERLGPEDRAVLERAAVVGRHFSRSAVAALLGRNGSELNARIEALQRTELIERDTGWFLGEPVLRFHHVLIRDAAYRRLLKGTRAELHEHLADWIEAQVKDAPEHDETIGWHLEQAHQHRRELGPLDAKGKTLGERAAARLAAAGRRALARDDLPVAADLLGRAIDRLDPDDPARAEVALDWCEALLAAGDVGTAAKAIDELGRFIGPTPLDTPVLSLVEGPPKEGGYSGQTVASSDSEESHRSSRVGPVSSGAVSRDRLAAWHICFTGQLTVLTAPQALHTTAGAVAAAAEELAKLGDAAGEATGHFVHALALSRLGKGGACEAALDRALAAARRADDRRRANTVLAVAPRAALWGPSPVTRASGRCLDVVRVLRITQGAPAVEAVALSCQAVLEALRGRTDAARRMIESARKLVEDLGITQRLLEVDVFGGLIDLLEGDAAAAERNLRRAYDGLRDLGLGIDAARAAALLARALLAQDRGPEAEALSHESEALAGDDLKAAIAWRGVRAEALARRGEHRPAIVLANEGVEIAAATDALLDHADARLALAAALRAAGHGREADAEEQRAVALWEAKGATVLADGARRRGTSEPQNDPRPLPEGDHREVGPPPAPRLAKEGEPSRRVQPNAATAMLVRLHAHLAGRDFDAVAKDSREDMESIDHPSGSSYGREAIVASLRRFFRSRDPHYEAEPLATLGDFLVLARRHTSASGGGGGRFDVGAYENDALELFEVDASGKTSRTEVFAADKLGAAVARLYERYADLLLDGPERIRTAATARSLAGWNGPIDPDRLATTMTPSIECVDHRNLGTWSARGAAEVLGHFRLQSQLATDFAGRTDEVLALAPDALLVRRTYFGSARDSGGAFENVVLELFAFGADGLRASAELWEPGHEAEALARFDDVVAGAEPQRGVRRRVTPNAATDNIERFGAAIAAHDLDGLARDLCEEVEVVHHQTAATYGRKAFLTTWRSMFNANKMIRQQEAIASLGNALALAHHTIALEGFAEAHLAAVGTVEIDEVILFEVDDRGRTRRFEIFPTEKLGAAVARLYERFAELLPEGPERGRAAATARSFAGWNGLIDADRLATTVTPSMEMVDHRNLGTWSTRGAEFLDHTRLQTELATGFTGRTDGVLALAPDALLVRCTYFGIGRDSGGAFENVLLQLFAFGSDGLIARSELWEPDLDAEALARFDALTADAGHAGTLAAGIQEGGAHSRPKAAGMTEGFPLVSGRRVRPNAATAWRARFDAALTACDFDAVAAAVHEEYQEIDHPTGSDYGRDAAIASLQRLFRSRDAYYEVEPLATLGERLLLVRRRTGASGDTRGRYDVGPYENEAIEVTEVDEHGLSFRQEVFAADRLGAALVRLYERYAELLPEGTERTRAAGIARTLEAFNGRRMDLDRLRAAYAPSHQCIDHRVFGTWSAGDAEELLRHIHLQLDLAPDFAARYDDVFAANAHTAVPRMTFFGTARESGEPFENELCFLFRFGADGRLTHTECREAEQVVEALARFDDITATAPDPRAVIATPNPASAWLHRFQSVFNARDWDGVRALYASQPTYEDRQRLSLISGGVDMMIASLHERAEAGARLERIELLGTAGSRVAIQRLLWAGGGSADRFEMEHLVVQEVNEAGQLVATINVDADDARAAQREAWARWAAIDPVAAPWVALLNDATDAWNAHDVAKVRAFFADDITVEDHRLAGLGRIEGADRYVESLVALWALAPDQRIEFGQSCAVDQHGAVFIQRRAGTLESGGAFENEYVWLAFARAGRITRLELFEIGTLDAALARFEELSAARTG